DSARQFRECAGAKPSHRGISASLEPKPQAVHLERHCRRDHQKDRSRAGEDGADQARIHPARGQREGASAVRLYTGHTTSNSSSLLAPNRVTYLSFSSSMASRLTLLLMPPSNTKTASRMPKRRRKVLNSPCVVVSPRLPRKTSKCSGKSCWR